MATSARLALVASLAGMLFAGPALAHHRPDHEGGPPDRRPTPTSTSTPTPTVATPTPTRTSPPSTGCAITGSLQNAINNAAAGSTLNLAGCTFREQVVVNKPLTIDGGGSGQILGSDIWSGWTASSGNWASTNSVPAMSSHGECSGDGRCHWPEQVFFDGVAQYQRPAGSDPGPGQFALDGSRRVVLGSDPSGKTVEVTTRTVWLNSGASGVTVRGMRMRHAASRAQDGALRASHANWTIENNVLSDAHGAVVNVQASNGHRVLNNEIARGGQQGLHMTGVADATVSGNRIHSNNTEDFSAGWEAGGMKATEMTRLVLDRNEANHNRGPGLWCDINCLDVTFSNNKVHHNDNAGIFFEISSGAKIFNNAVWGNGWGFTPWGWGAGILVSSSANAEVYGNTLAWNADGISIISQNRGSTWGNVVNNYVHDNTVVVGTAGEYMLAWLQDWAGVMFNASSNNRGALNRYWNARADGVSCRFAWQGCLSTLAAFNATPGDEGGRYLSLAERDTALSAAGIPLSP